MSKWDILAPRLLLLSKRVYDLRPQAVGTHWGCDQCRLCAGHASKTSNPCRFGNPRCRWHLEGGRPVPAPGDRIGRLSAFYGRFEAAGQPLSDLVLGSALLVPTAAPNLLNPAA
jgi:hypothetical protein